MSWFKIDDQFADHPKVVALQDRGEWKGALALWTLAGSWCSRQLTNGHVPPSVVRRLGCSAEDAAALVSVGLWHEVDGGYQFNDWSRYNPTREDVEARREKNRRKLQQWRDSKRGEAAQHGEDAERNQVTSELLASCNQVTPLVRNQVGNQVRNSVCNPAPDPTRPVPDPDPDPDQDSLSAAEPPQRGKPRSDVAEVFDHWRTALGKSQATKLDVKRKRRIEWALRAYGLDAVKRCIDGYAASRWHRGENDRGRPYDDLTLWLRDAEHIERGIAMADQAGPAALPTRGALPPARIDPEAARESQRKALELFGAPDEAARVV